MGVILKDELAEADRWIQHLVGPHERSVSARRKDLGERGFRLALSRHPEAAPTVVRLAKCLPDSLLAELAADHNIAVRCAVASRRALRRLPDVATALSQDPDAAVREAVARNQHTPSAIRDALLQDLDDGVRYAAGLHRDG